MSTPPPGGPPTQPPPTYPQYPPPGSAPPPYPPPQPYYGPPMPPPKESNTVLIVVLVVVVVIVVLAALAVWFVTAILSPVQNFARVTVTDTSWAINGDKINFASSNLACGSACPQTVFAGTPMTFTVTMRNTDPASPHNVTSISVGAPFTLDSVAPPVPYLVLASSSTTFQITVSATTPGGSYVLSGVIVTD